MVGRALCVGTAQQRRSRGSRERKRRGMRGLTELEMEEDKNKLGRGVRGGGTSLFLCSETQQATPFKKKWLLLSCVTVGDMLRGSLAFE